jgi:hypothetical protein
VIRQGGVTDTPYMGCVREGGLEGFVMRQGGGDRGMGLAR